MLFSMVKCYLEYTFSVILCHLYGSVYIYYNVYIYIYIYMYTLNSVIYIYYTYICGDEKSFRVSLNEDRAFSMSFVYALEADVLPMFRDVLPRCRGCRGQDALPSLFVEIFDLGEIPSLGYKPQWLSGPKNVGMEFSRTSVTSAQQETHQPVSTPGESPNHRNSGDLG